MTNLLQLDTYGVIHHDLGKVDFLLDEISKIEKDFDAAKDASYKLVGHIEKQYELSENCVIQLESLLMPLIERYSEYKNILTNKYNVTIKPLPLCLPDAWVNFQKKYEYNPVHNHGGIFSFVIWLKVPYNREDEDKIGTCNGKFELFYQDTMGGLSAVTLPIDKSFENTMLLFPAQMHHCVYPFYTSDDYRVSIAGNFYLKS
jgi:hypothetical protein